MAVTLRPLLYPFRQLLAFGCQQALSCLFPGVLFLTFALTRLVSTPGLPRYDLILLVCLLMQMGMVSLKLETKDELKVIGVFHLAGLGLELFKTHAGCWAYPEAGWAKVAGVPLYSGFMYASVASYLCQAWRRLRVTLDAWPATRATGLLAGAIYVNFFTEGWLGDARWILAALIAWTFRRTRVGFGVRGDTYAMPMSLAFVLLGFFLWVAENVATYFGAWQYPSQRLAWRPVGLEKMSSWSLLVIFSFLIVAQLKRLKGRQPSEGRPADRPAAQWSGSARSRRSGRRGRSPRPRARRDSSSPAIP